MRLGHEYSIDIKTAHFKFTPYHKFNILLDKSGVGKTTLLKEIAYNGMLTDMRVLYSYGNMSIIDQACDYLILFDETQLFRFIDKYGIKTLNNSDNTFLIICRDILCFTSIDYRAVYTLESDGRYYTPKRKFPDYKTFKHASNYLIEDSKFGKKYFESKLENVVSANGKANIPNVVSNDTTIIADGAAFANELYECLKVRKKNVNYFLPDSFEGLVLENTKSAEDCVANSHKDPVLKYPSIERYYSDNISKYYPGYTKENGHTNILSKNLFNVLGLNEFEIAKYASMCPMSVATNLGLETDIERATYVVNKYGKI